MRALHGAVPVLLAAITLQGPVAGAQTFSQPGNHSTQLAVEVHGVLNGLLFDYGTAYGAGARVNIPIGRNLFLPRVNNSLVLSVGGDVVYDAYILYRSAFVDGIGTLQWNFHVAPNWTVFGELGVFTSFLVDTGVCAGAHCAAVYLLPEFAGGVRWHFVTAQGYPELVVRLGYPSGFNIGISFPISPPLANRGVAVRGSPGEWPEPASL